ncbi:MAG: hypothetical protein Q7S21_05730 [archaeon]|nr:hypothetical protein [archaeon]
MSSDYRIKEINYQIQRVNIELKNLEKMLFIRKKMKTLTDEDSYDLKQQLDKKQMLVATLETEIRKIENEKLRAQNLNRAEIRV